MKTNTVVYGLSIAIIVILLIVAVVFIVLDVKKSNKPPYHLRNPRPYPNNIGGETDKYGCHISAGYKWCKNKKKCIRPWEEHC